MSTGTPVAPVPRTRRSREVVRTVSGVVVRLRALGVDPGPAALGADDLGAALRVADRALDAVLAELRTAPRARRAALAAIVVELHDARRSARALRMAGRARPLDAIDQSVTRLRNVATTAGLLDRVCAEATHCSGLGRVVLTPPGETAALPAPAVVVPIPVSTGTLALLHGDHHPTDRPADDLDRELLGAFARAFGRIYERTALQERLERQRRTLVAALEAESAAADRLGDAGFALPGTEEADDEAPATHPTASRGNAALDALLTPREREVLELILAGASNGVISERLVITTGTVKSHVKRVLRKLGAANRSEAISRYLELGTDGG